VVERANAGDVEGSPDPLHARPGPSGSSGEAGSRTWVEAVTAVVVPKAGAAITPEVLIAHARERLAGYKAPKDVVLAESLPRNPSGKILKRELRDTFRSLASTTESA
jgi:acyl-CoA synthetase (AMP-forming)/AMP-acid ligase II